MDLRDPSSVPACSPSGKSRLVSQLEASFDSEWGRPRRDAAPPANVTAGLRSGICHMQRVVLERARSYCVLTKSNRSVTAEVAPAPTVLEFDPPCQAVALSAPGTPADLVPSPSMHHRGSDTPYPCLLHRLIIIIMIQLSLSLQTWQGSCRAFEWQLSVPLAD